MMRYAMLALAMAATAATAQEATPDWQYYEDAEATNGLLQAFVQAADGTQLIFKCDEAGKNKVFAIMVSTERLAAPSSRFFLSKVVLRYDEGSPNDERWRYFETTATAVNAPGERSLTRFLEKVADAKKLDVTFERLERNGPEPIHTSFKVEGARAAIGHVYESCKDQNPLGG
jgi:hypothetical protein